MNWIFQDIIDGAEEKLKFVENTKAVTFVTGENKGQVIILIDDDMDEIEISLDDVTLALKNYYKLIISKTKKCMDADEK